MCECKYCSDANNVISTVFYYYRPANSSNEVDIDNSEIAFCPLCGNEVQKNFLHFDFTSVDKEKEITTNAFLKIEMPKSCHSCVFSGEVSSDDGFESMYCTMLIGSDTWVPSEGRRHDCPLKEEHLLLSDAKEDVSKLLTEVARAMWNHEVDEDGIERVAKKYGYEFDLGIMKKLDSCNRHED